MAEIQEFSPFAETVTASMTLPQECGEHYGPPLTIGFYPGQREIWIEGEHGRQNIAIGHLPAVIRQLKRAAVLAKGHAKEPDND